MIFISHDRYFINRMANKVVEVKEGRLREFSGDYDDYLRKSAEREGGKAGVGSSQEELVSGTRQRASSGEEAAPAVRRRRKEEKRRAAEERQRRSRLLSPLKERLSQIEEEIHSKEARLGQVMQLLSQPEIYRNGGQARQAVGEKEDLEDGIQALYQEWEEISLQIEEVMQGIKEKGAPRVRGPSI